MGVPGPDLRRRLRPCVMPLLTSLLLRLLSVLFLPSPSAASAQEGARPTHKKGPLGCLGIAGRCGTTVVDSVDSFRAELEEDEARITRVRHEVLTDRELVPMPPEFYTAKGLQRRFRKSVETAAETFGVAAPLKKLPLLGKSVEGAPLRPAAFVTFRRARTAALAAQALHMQDPYAW